jgi:hypothetical protein
VPAAEPIFRAVIPGLSTGPPPRSAVPALAAGLTGGGEPWRTTSVPTPASAIAAMAATPFHMAAIGSVAGATAVDH